MKKPKKRRLKIRLTRAWYVSIEDENENEVDNDWCFGTREVWKLNKKTGEYELENCGSLMLTLEEAHYSEQQAVQPVRMQVLQGRTPVHAEDHGKGRDRDVLRPGAAGRL